MAQKALKGPGTRREAFRATQGMEGGNQVQAKWGTQGGSLPCLGIPRWPALRVSWEGGRLSRQALSEPWAGPQSGRPHGLLAIHVIL